MTDAATKPWIRNAADEQAVSEGCYFDATAAERVKTFFAKFLRHSKGQWAGEPFSLLDWQYDDLIAPLFGWKRKDGSRRFRVAYVEIPKKNGKSTIASGVGLYMLVGDGEPGAEVYSVAADRNQANIVHGEAVRMVDASPALSKYLDVNRSSFNIAFHRANSWYRSLSSEANTKEGLNAHCRIHDELHAWKGRGLWDALKYAGASRRQPLSFSITTAGDDMESVCREQHDYAKDVLSGAVKDTRFFAYIRAADTVVEGAEKDDDWTEPAVWRKANPSLGVTMSEKDFADDCEEAKKSPVMQSSFKRYRLNIWASGTCPWLRPEAWLACRDDYAAEDLAGRPCFGGLDLSKSRDMTALVLCFPEIEEVYRLLAWFWLPEDTVNDPDSPEYLRVWRRQNFLQVTPGGVCDYRVIKETVKALAERYEIRDLAYDPYNAEQVTQEIEAETGVKRVLFPQTINHFAGPTGEFERLVLAGKLRHNGHPIMTWQAGHVQVKVDLNNNKRPVKPAPHDRRKIDGIVGAIMALARATLQPAEAEYDGGFEAW